MSFVVETGAGLDNANALVSVDDCDDYHDLRNNTTWTGTTAVKQAAIVKATDFLCSEYAWAGLRATEDQALCWPRVSDDGTTALPDADGFEIGIDTVPDVVTYACCDLALEAMAEGKLSEAQDRGGMVKSETVGPISVTYMEGAPAGKEYPAVEARLRRAGLVEPDDVITLGRA